MWALLHNTLFSVVSFHADVLSDIICLCLWSNSCLLFSSVRTRGRTTWPCLTAAPMDARSWRAWARPRQTEPHGTSWYLPSILFSLCRHIYTFHRGIIYRGSLQVSLLQKFYFDKFVKFSNWCIHKKLQRTYCYNSTTARQGFSSGNVWMLKTWWTQRVPIKSWWMRRSTEAHCKDKIKGWRHLNLEKLLKQYGFTSRYISVIWQLK